MSWPVSSHPEINIVAGWNRGYFCAAILDDDTSLLMKSYRLRYQVYCVERQFLNVDDYPEQLEKDEYDIHSLHFGILNADNDIVGSIRTVKPNAAVGLPMHQHCEVFAEQREGLQQLEATGQIIEVSRLSVSRLYRRRAGDGLYSISKQGLMPEPSQPSSIQLHSRRRQPVPMVTLLYKAFIQTALRHGVSHLLAAMERSLYILLKRSGFPFQPIGPEADYFGLVSPYILDLGQFYQKLRVAQPTVFEEFILGLEPEFYPDTIRHIIS